MIEDLSIKISTTDYEFAKKLMIGSELAVVTLEVGDKKFEKNVQVYSIRAAECFFHSPDVGGVPIRVKNPEYVISFVEVG